MDHLFSNYYMHVTTHKLQSKHFRRHPVSNIVFKPQHECFKTQLAAPLLAAEKSSRKQAPKEVDNGRVDRRRRSAMLRERFLKLSYQKTHFGR